MSKSRGKNSEAASEAAPVTEECAALPLAIVRYAVSDTEIESLEQIKATRDLIEESFGAYRGILFDTPENYERGRKAIAHLRSTRTAVDKYRLELNEEPRRKIKRNDAKAKEIIGLIEAIENPLHEAKDDVDAAREKARRLAEDAERERVRAEQEAKIAADRAELERKQREIDEMNAQMAEERRALDAERAEIARQKAASAPQPNPGAPRAPEPPMFTESDEAEIFGAAPTEPAGAAAQPPAAAVSGDAELVAAYAASIRALRAPEVVSPVAAAIVEQAQALLDEAARDLEVFAGTRAEAAE